MLNKGQHIYIGGIGDLDDPRIKEEYSYTYPGKGTFFVNGRNLQFMVIANEYGECYDANFGDLKPCPRNEFPIDLKEK